MKSSTNISVSVVGCGYWGPNLIRNFRSLTDCAVKQACDSDGCRLDHMRRIFPEVGSTRHFDECINDPELDAVAIALPLHLHFEMAKKSLMAGKHTFIEKPMAASADECKELIELAGEKELVLMVGHTFLYSTPVQRIKQIVESRDLGELLYINSQRLNLGLFQKDFNVAWDLAPHDISIILHIMGDVPVAVNCQGKAHITKGIEDITNMTLTFSNGGFAIVQNSWLDPNKVRRMAFVGSKRMLLYDDNEPLEKIKIYDKRVETPPYYNTFAEFHYSYHYGDTYSPYLNQVEPLKVQCQHFLDCIRGSQVPLTNGLEGLKVVRILEAATESLRKEGARVEIKWDQLNDLAASQGPQPAVRLASR